MSETDDLISRYQYGANYVTDYDELRRRVLDKTVIPHQVEIQPASRSNEICWLKCPWCYGLSAKDTGERLSPERAVEVMKQIAAGGVRKVIFAGYATDPLNCRYLEDLLAVAIDNRQVFGFNTKAIKTSDRLLELLSTPSIAAKSYLSISVDAGSSAVYNMSHAVENLKARIYERVRDNVSRVAQARARAGVPFDISATYLINSTNNAPDEVLSFIRDFRGAGCNLLRFTFPQLPRDFVPTEGVIPSHTEVKRYTVKLRELIESQSTDACPVLFVDADSEHDLFRKPRTVPCFARFIYPTVGFDGWLYHCSQSSAPNFRALALGNLAEHDFWELFYNYDAENLDDYFERCSSNMASTGCRCDRKEHVVNLSVRRSGAFEHLLGPAV